MKRRSFLAGGAFLLHAALRSEAQGIAPERGPVTAPDRLPLPTVRVGAAVEASARISLDLPESAPLDVKTKAPSFIQVRGVELHRDPRGPGGNTQCDVLLSLDTSRAGEYAGSVEVDVAGRAAAVPVTVKVVAQEPGLPRVLIASTPFSRASTGDSAHFRPLLDLLNAAPAEIHYTRLLPSKLDAFNTILLAEEALALHYDRAFDPLTTFVENGGRLIVVASWFMSGTSENANRLLKPYGMEIEDLTDKVVEEKVDLKPAGQDPLTRGLGMVRFERPAPILVTDARRARLLFGGGMVGTKGMMAVWRDRGEVVVLTPPIWWHWIGQGPGEQAALMRNLLTLPRTG